MFKVNNAWLMIAILFEKHSQYLLAQRVSCWKGNVDQKV